MKTVLKRVVVCMVAGLSMIPIIPSVYAASNLDTPAKTYNGTSYYEIASSTDWSAISRETTELSPAITYTFYSSWYTFDDGKAYVNASDAAKAKKVIDETDAWLAKNMKNIIPDGTKRDEAINKIIRWVVNRMTYKETSDEQSAVPCFEKGIGNCATYTAQFDAMVHYLPFKDGKVNYKSGMTHLTVRPVYAKEHCWSAVQIDGRWKFFDLTYYDALKGKKWIWSDDATFGGDPKHKVEVF